MRRTLYAIAALIAIAGLLGMAPMAIQHYAAARASSVRTAVTSGDTASRAASVTAAASVAATGPALPDGSHSARVVAARALGAIGGTLPRRLVRPRLVVEKTGRTLTVYSAGKAVKVYRIALGRSPEGDKTREGDGRTPLGSFYVCNKNAQSSYHKSLGLSYPSAEDAKRGRSAGLISSSQQRAIVEAVEHHRQPPWDTKLGGMIMIHGGGTAIDWTTGCIALSNANIDELFAKVPVGTPVVVEERPQP